MFDKLKTHANAFALGFAACCFAGALPANAADYYQPTSSYYWSGLYGGVHAGVAAAHVKHYDNFSSGTLLDHNVSGAVFGGQIGYNRQSGNHVYGIEASVSGTSVEGSATSPSTRSFKLKSVIDLRGRLGYAFDKTLLYTTAGVSIANVHVSQHFDSADGTHAGFVVGVGAAWRPAKHMSIGAEYLFAHYGNKSYDFGGAPDDVSFGTHTLRAVVNFHLDSHK